jgi:hypothetical protein
MVVVNIFVIEIAIVIVIDIITIIIMIAINLYILRFMFEILKNSVQRKD